MSQFHDSIGRAEKTGILQGNLACFGPEARRRRPRVAKKRCGPMASGDALWEWDSRRWTRVFCLCKDARAGCGFSQVWFCVEVWRIFIKNVKPDE
jgi:hypothetical protein